MLNTRDKGIVKSINTALWILCLGVLITGTGLFPLAATAETSNVEEILKRYIKEHYPWPEVEINDLTVSSELPDRYPSKIIIEKGLPGKTVFTLEFDNLEKLTATANVKAFDSIVLSRRAFRKGRTLQDDDVYTMLMDVRRIPAGAVKNIEQVAGKPLTRTIVANMPIVSGMLSETPLVKRGTRVTLLVEARGFTITTTGETRENSSVGKYVKAVNPASKRTVTGILVDENTVRVEL
jgi:flagella basal body P-ring formation protein FlgA